MNKLLQRYLTITTTPNVTVINGYNCCNIIVPIDRRKIVAIDAPIATVLRTITLPITIEI